MAQSVSSVFGAIPAVGTTNKLPPGIKRAPVTQKAEGKKFATSASALEALRNLFKTFPGEGTEPAQREKWLETLGDKKKYASRHYTKLGEVSELHTAIAQSFNQDETLDARDEETKDEKPDGYWERAAFKKLEGSPDMSSKLNHLLAQGTHQRTILHIILDFNTYSPKFRFSRLKPLIKLLLWLQPDLPKVAADSDATPLFNLVMSRAEKADDDDDDDDDARSATGSNPDDPNASFPDDKTTAEIVEFLCESAPKGVESKQAIESLGLPASMVSDDSSQARNAIHAAIEADFAISEGIIAKLSKISVPFKVDHAAEVEKTPCLEIPDRLGRTCLHIALAAPFSETKIFWAKQLAKYQPSLLKVKFKYKDKSGSEVEMTPLQHFTKERDDNVTAVHKDKEKTSAKTSTVVNLPRELDLMEEFLKCRCLEAFDDNDTCKSIMYTRENAKEIFLTFDDETITTELLENQSSHYRLDTSLKAVHILSNNQIEWDEKRKDDKEILNIVNLWRCPGNKDLYMIFHWLKQPKIDPQGTKEDRPGIKKVFEIMVDELPNSGTLPHSDRAIVECLRDLNVETWDWKRMDIPFDVIDEAAGSSVKTLYLYCSGLKAVLRSWSDTKGLVNLKKLERVEVELHQGLESKDSMRKSADEFKADLERLHTEKYKDLIEKKEKKKLEVICTPIFTQSKMTFLNEEAASKMKTDGEPGFEEQDWLKCMDEFADLMEYIETMPKTSGIGKARPIKIALIDDGVKTSYASLNENIDCGKSGWSTATLKGSGKKKPTKTYLRNYNWSHTGHGTVMAYYIRRVCPKVKLCVAKLDPQARPRSNMGGGNSDQITFSIESVIEAIKWAVTEKVDIISMSWAIDPHEDGNENQKRRTLLHGAINLATDNNILLFCANPDKGEAYPDNWTYPRAAAPPKTLFVVGAAKDDGKRWKKISDKDDSCDFFLPGVDLGIQVESTNRKKSLENPPPEWRKHSGSSLSCALASGLAAMVLHCAQVSNKVTADVENDSKWAWLKRWDGMSEALRSINVDRRDSGKGQWLGVRRLFGEAVKSLDGPPDEAFKALNEKVVSKLLAASPSGSKRTDPAPGTFRRTLTNANME